ncbi:hypothetical protein N7481_004305 [Penicillium waksmanii]|uniref:uncharacterized protein n=1 Tax=Penicillium waksmanii TaxID=69791 RepID=UPI0025488ED5|nr:uncharacterized protein N7481_004305 [Penicillium waksmanii]KAJ5989095.1 hypothetical protein N7481_004305 [Penicillium waksmanii]
MTLPKHFPGPQSPKSKPEGPIRTDSHRMTVDHNSTQPTVLNIAFRSASHGQNLAASKPTGV